jgi:signal transduction histidine kinase
MGILKKTGSELFHGKRNDFQKSAYISVHSICFVFFMKYFLLAIVLLFKGSLLSGQSDSTLIKKTDALIEASYELTYNKPDSALLILDSAETLARSIGYRKGVSAVLRQKGLFYSERSEYVRSMEFLFKALEEDEKLSNHDGIGMDLLFIGLNFYHQGKASESFSFMERAKKTYVGIKDEAGEAMVNSNLGMIYRNTNRYKEALDAYLKVRDYYQRDKNDRNLSRVENNLGNIYKDLKEYDKALEHFNVAKDLKIKVKDMYGLIMTYSNIADVYVSTNNPQKAFEYYEMALKLSKEQKAVGRQKDIHLDLSKAYEKQGNLQKSLENYKLYSLLKDSIISEKFNNDLADMKVKYESDKKESENIVLKKDNELQQIKIHEERIMKLLFAVLFIIVFFAAFLVYLQYRNKRKLNKELKRINEKVSSQNNTLRILNIELIESEEELKKANDTKDELISMISHDLYNPVTSVINYTSGIIDKSKELSREELLRSIEMTGNSIIPLKDLLDNILQWALIQKGGIKPREELTDVKAIAEDIVRIYRPTAEFNNINIEFKYDENCIIRTDRLMISFILRNLINNAVKFSLPYKQISLELIKQDAGLLVSISDEGKGFTEEMLKCLDSENECTSEQADGSGIGLAVSRRFVKLLNGELKFRNRKNGGAQVSLIINPA